MKTAVALQYDPQLPAPFVLAKGKDQLAARIRDLAEQHKIPVVEDPGLADALYIVEPAEFVPEEFYRVIAEILVFIGTVDTTGQQV